MKKRTSLYKNSEDKQLLTSIKKITNQRSSYGYRRVTALLTNNLPLSKNPGLITNESIVL